MDREDFKFVRMLCLMVVLVLFLLMLPFSWFEGHAKSAYLKKTQGIEIPWYQATFLTVEINAVNADVKMKKE